MSLNQNPLEKKRMRDENTARGCVIRNLQKLNQRIAELEYTKAELKRVQELLRKERETFFPILHKAPYGIALIDNDGKFIYVNPAFTNLTGYTLEDMSSGRDGSRAASSFLEYRQEMIDTRKRDGIDKRQENTLSVICKNGEIKQIECKPTSLDDGRIVVILSEMTKWQRSELSCPT
jgi:PAS domain S-box-containing protein